MLHPHNTPPGRPSDGCHTGVTFGCPHALWRLTCYYIGGSQLSGRPAGRPAGRPTVRCHTDVTRVSHCHVDHLGVSP